jgi:hypothetical protein
LRKIPAELCVRCKGKKLLCGLNSCPILERFRAVVNTTLRIDLESKRLDGATPPSVVVGEKGYPNISLSFNLPPGVFGYEAKEYENPREWWGRKSINEIVSYRASLVSNVIKAKVKDVWELYDKEIALAAISHTPVGSESLIEGRVEAKLRFDGYVMPRGPSVLAKNVKVVDNPKLSKAFERLIFDDVNAQEAVKELYSSGEEVYKIINAMSLGLLGRKKNRRLVPTRWAITAVDSAIGKQLLEEVRGYESVDKVEVYYQKYLGNYFHVILYPSAYNVTWVEIWHPLSLWSSELVVSDLRENFWGEYDFMDGGYMAARTSVLEYLSKVRRSAGVIIIREITPEYFAPLGNWHIRETVRKAMENKVSTFDTLEEAIKFVQARLRGKVNLTEVKSIRSVLTQKTIDSFFK